MTLSMQRLQRSNRIRVLLAFAWVPYIAIRCVAGSSSHGSCGMLAPVVQTANSHHHEHKAEHAHRHHEEGSNPASSGKTCCEVTGKCNVSLTATPSVSDSHTVAAILAHFPITTAPVSIHSHTRPAYVAHGPPIYLRLATLLI